MSLPERDVGEELSPGYTQYKYRYSTEEKVQAEGLYSHLEYRPKACTLLHCNLECRPKACTCTER